MRKRRRTPKTADKPSDTSGHEEEEIDVSEQAEVSRDDNDAADQTTVYAEGIPYDATEPDVREFFRSCGKIRSLRMPLYDFAARALLKRASFLMHVSMFAVGMIPDAHAATRMLNSRRSRRRKRLWR